MWFTVFFFFAGVPLGYLVRKPPLAIRLAGFVSVWSVRVLLFLLGLTLGANDALFAQLDTLGVQAVCIAVSAVLGSLIGVRFLGGWLRLEEKGNGKQADEASGQAAEAGDPSRHSHTDPAGEGMA